MLETHQLNRYAKWIIILSTNKVCFKKKEQDKKNHGIPSNYIKILWNYITNHSLPDGLNPKADFLIIFFPTKHLGIKTNLLELSVFIAQEWVTFISDFFMEEKKSHTQIIMKREEITDVKS